MSNNPRGGHRPNNPKFPIGNLPEGLYVRYTADDESTQEGFVQSKAGNTYTILDDVTRLEVEINLLDVISYHKNLGMYVDFY